ncbi:hypothetical protein SAMN05878281_1400 [Salegentibacter salegens]|uniref:Uncharacterized protein n=1 Tax=Salegentibacter salegens TaxID=143223 RepID=A0A1M7KHD1_9FLAO|nr:hypothetical protein LY58_01049 [Salegentibacter salegens]SHM64293.1 hypothetical protein SAMN05878281_1400 [Salegentibacter salegens]
MGKRSRGLNLQHNAKLPGIEFLKRNIEISKSTENQLILV